MSVLHRLANRVNATLETLFGSSGLLRDYRLLGLLVGGSAVVALAAVPDVPRWVAPLGALLGYLYYMLATKRERHRQELTRVPFPDAHREVLLRRVPLYLQLDAPERLRFEREIQIFLGEQRIYPLDVPGRVLPTGERVTPFDVTEEQRVLIAASAATLLLGRPEWRLPTTRDIVVYPTAFAEETYDMGGHAHTIGMVHAQGPVLFAADALERSYPVQHTAFGGWGAPQDPSNVGIHEFAHVLDFIGLPAQTGAMRAHGVPGILGGGSLAERWSAQLQTERERLSLGQSILHPYALKNEAELFAVAVETFFLDAVRMRAEHPDLYGLLADFFNQDPATRALYAQRDGGRSPFRPWFAMGAPARYLA